MRAILAIIIVVLLLILIPPYWFGMKAEEEYNNLTENVSKFENLEIVTQQYKRGWLQSTAEITYSIKDIEEGDIIIIEKDTIYHGPIPIGLLSKGKVMLKPVMAIIETEAQISTTSEEEYAELVNSLPLMDFETILSLDGSGTTEVLIPSVDHKFEDGKTLKWSGLDGLINFAPNLTQVSSVINSGDLEIEDDSFRLTIKGIDIESNLDYPATNYKNPLGNVNVKVEEFSSNGKDGDELNQLTLSNLEFKGSTDQKGQLIDHIHSLGFETLTVGGNSYGPGIYELQMRNIDKQVFEEIQTALEQSQNQQGASSTDLLSAELMKALPSLFKNSPEIEITKLSMKTGEGEIDGHAIISVSGDSLDNAELATNPIFLLAAVTADLRLSVSKPLMDNLLKDYKIEEITDDFSSRDEEIPSESELQTLGKVKAQSEIQEMLDQGILILKDGKYQIEASYSLGQVKLNGNPLDINSLLNLTSGT